MKYRIVTDNIVNPNYYNIYIIISLIMLFIFLYRNTRENKTKK